MRGRRIGALLLMLFGVAGVKLGQEIYRWAAFGEERQQLVALRERVIDAGAEVIRTSTLTDSLKAEIDGVDRELAQQRRSVERYDRYAHGGALPAHLYPSYRAELDRFNRHVEARNQQAERWKAVVESNHEAVRRYNALADSIRTIAARLGEEYYSVPLPAEAAVARGFVPRAAAAEVRASER
jgi:hypothetical protein